MYDYARMMGISDLAPEQTVPEETDMAEAIFGRATFVQNPEIHQDYEGVNPYADDAHGSWQDGISSFLDGLGNPFGGDPSAGLELPFEDDTEDPEGVRDDLIEQDQAEMQLSDEYQKSQMGG
jgi:hypothetical protein